MSDSLQPHGLYSPPGSFVHGILQARILEWIAIPFSRILDYTLSPIWLLWTPWTVAHQASLSMGFPRWDYWRRLPCPLPGDLPDQGIKPTSPVSPALQADSLPLCYLGSLLRLRELLIYYCIYFFPSRSYIAYLNN